MTTNRSFSFQRLLESGDEATRAYVTRDIRGSEVARFLTAFLPPDPHARLLDIGCGSGLLSFGLAAHYGLIVAGDRQPENVALTARGAAQRSIGNLRTATLDAVRLPFSGAAFDGVIVNGVLEWVGLNDRGEHPAAIQQRFLGEVRRVLKPGGVLYLAIENRAALRYILRDPHTGRPLVNILPRRVADRVSRSFYREPYQVYIYTPRQLTRRLERAGFGDLRLFTPVPSYQYPFHYVSLSSASASVRDIDAIDTARMDGLLQQSPLSITAADLARKLRLRSRLGLLKLTARDLICVCRPV